VRWTVAYTMLGLACAGPLLRPGLVLSLDLSPSLSARLPTAYHGLAQTPNEGSLGRLPIDLIYALLGRLHVIAVSQKALLVAIVALAGLGMHRLLADRSPAAATFGGTLYAINPFVVDRLLGGQWLLLLSYALLPWLVAAFSAALEGQRWAPWRFAALLAAAGAAGPHLAALGLLLCVLRALGDAGPHGRTLRRAGAALAAGGAGSLLWLIPAPGLHELWDHVGSSQLDYYATVSRGGWGPLPTVLGLQGFFNATSVSSVTWIIGGLALAALAGCGLAAGRRDPLCRACAAAGLLGVLVAVAPASGLLHGGYADLMDRVAPLRAFREPQKAVALVVFAYAVLGARAVDGLLARRRAAARVAVALVPLALAAPLVPALWSHLRPVHYPRSWSQAGAILAGETHGARTAFLPWHGYLSLGFAHDAVVLNPAPGFFSVPVVASRSVTPDPALDDAAGADDGALRAILDAGPGHAAARCLAALGISHVLLAHEADWRSAAWLAREPGLTVRARWPDLTLLALRRPGAPAMTVAAGTGGRCPRGLRPLPSRRTSTTTLRLDAPVPAGRRLVLGLPEARRWRVDGAAARYGPWSAYRRIYALAGTGLILLLGGAAWRLRADRRRRSPSANRPLSPTPDAG
jgi:hypothetical protein